MVDHPLISIVVPVFNMENVADKCLRKLLKQDYNNIEYIFVDDGSTDNSLNICKRIAAENYNIRVFHTENSGSGPARNYGLSVAKGQYVYFPDADDYLQSDAISRLVQHIKLTPDADLFVFGFKNMSEHGKTISIKSYPDKVYDATELRMDYSRCMGTQTSLGIQGAPWNKLFKMSVIREHRIEFPPLRRHQDEGFISRYMCYTTRIAFMSDVLYSYFVNDIRKVWHKYPIDYYKAAIGLNEIRRATILKWNAHDLNTHDFIRREYICNIIKSLELAFSPKVKRAGMSKLKYIDSIINETALCQQKRPSNLGIYQRMILCLFDISVLVALPALWLKVLANKLGIVR